MLRTSALITSSEKSPRNEVVTALPLPRMDAAFTESARATSLIEVHRDVSASGVRLRATEWKGERDKEPCAVPVVALPGVLSPRESYARLAARMVPQFRFISVDLPGFGESEKHSPARYAYGVTAFAEAIADLFGGLGLGQAHVLGHGIGGAVALRLSVDHPELVKRLALIAPLSIAPTMNATDSLLLSPLLGGLVFRQMLSRPWFRHYYRSRINPEATRDELNHYYERISAPATRAALLATLRSCRDGASLIADSRRVRVPSLLLWGRRDRLLPVHLGRRLSREMPEAGLEIMECEHAPHEQLPSETARVLCDFFLGKRPGG